LEAAPEVLLDEGLNIGEELILAEDNPVLGDVLLKAAVRGGHHAAERAGVALEAGQVAALHAGLRIRIHFIRIRIQHFRMNTDPDPGL
jgi:hypothetical protein